MKQKVIVILGQTATGKSSLAVRIAKKIDGEIISADSRQVYAGLNIGTGKITKSEMKAVPHHLLDVANPKRVFNVAEFQQLAEEKIADILARGKTPVVCGGTGFYVDALTRGTVFPEVSPDRELRTRLEKKPEPILFKILKRLDPRRAKNIDAKNKVRLVRAIEIAKHLGTVPALTVKKPQYQFVKIGLWLPASKLERKIKVRLDKRMKAGMLVEAKKLHREGLSWKRMKELGLEYRFMALYLENKISKKEMLVGLEAAINNYARRQVTWFKRDKEIRWFMPNDAAMILRTFAEDPK